MPDDIVSDESWETTSGLLDDFDGEVVESYFGYNPQYGGGDTLLLNWKVKTAEGDQDLLISCGKKWETVDGGKSAQRTDGGKEQFVKTSHYGMILERVKKLGAIDVLRTRGRATEADLWTGTRWHFKREKVSYGGEIGDKEKVMPVDFLGEGAGASGGNGGQTTSSLDPTLKASILALASECKGADKPYDVFLTNAYQIEGVDGNPDAEKFVVDAQNGAWSLA